MKEHSDLIDQRLKDFEWARINRFFLLAGKNLGEIGRILVWI